MVVGGLKPGSTVEAKVIMWSNQGCVEVCPVSEPVTLDGAVDGAVDPPSAEQPLNAASEAPEAAAIEDAGSEPDDVTENFRKLVRSGELLEAMKCLDQGANPNRKGFTPLMQSFAWDKRDFVRKMLDCRADVNATCEGVVERHRDKLEITGWTALHEAAERMHGHAAEDLLAGGADLYRETSIGETPLDVAYAEHGSTIGSGWSYPKGNVVKVLEAAERSKPNPKPPKPSVLYKKTSGAMCGPLVYTTKGSFGRDFESMDQALKLCVHLGYTPGVDFCKLQVTRGTWPKDPCGSKDQFCIYGPGDESGAAGKDCWTVVAPDAAPGEKPSRGYVYREVTCED
eukprot:TRINITY_DN36796_c0_g1_i1.p1 TRINITY_DN36796_c0_g1~~TRINITY_DN36796_c0_g1_i1.p1  ORF type:complete len:341 (+),score=45.27 TRINITY_DN36796_c0_g1_i1:443-1465(+)